MRGFFNGYSWLLGSSMSAIVDFISVENLAESQRLFHGRGHAFPGLEHVCVDWFEPLVLITLYKEESEAWLNATALQLAELVEGCKSIQVQHRWQRNAPFECLWGDAINDAIAIESGNKYHISLGSAQNTGLFLDMKNGRDWVQAHAAGKSVLNLFSYTCAFSVAAIAGGAEQVVNIDLSKASLARGRDNHRLNKQDTGKVKFQGVDIFKSFGRLKRHGPYQMIIVDPPSFQKGSVNIEKDYGKIIRRIPEFADSGAQVMLCLNNPDLDREFIFEQVKTHCPALAHEGDILPPEVFKEAHTGRGLKVMIFNYCA